MSGVFVPRRLEYLMTRLLIYLLLFAILIFGLWPYYTLFRLDQALAEPEPQALAPYVDLAAIRMQYKERLEGTADAFLPTGNGEAEQVIDWLAENLRRLGASALDQAITLEWVRNALQEAAQRATGAPQPGLIAAVDFAFFESWDRFVIRIGDLGQQTHVVMRLQGTDWRITDVVR